MLLRRILVLTVYYPKVACYQPAKNIKISRIFQIHVKIVVILSEAKNLAVKGNFKKCRYF